MRSSKQSAISTLEGGPEDREARWRGEGGGMKTTRLSKAFSNSQ